ncbi:hypothetical protein RI129_001976 [Pyrocoelia pectoralis]|uniref:MORN repeat-containing protein 5 n=1 Tax=Pyrocoelia pectoralis TaxID=417401 RepID=A0AAN7ZQ66_9COLE
MYHDEGRVTYPMGHTLRGTWFHGKLTGYKFNFPDSLTYEENWKYCKMPDRRLVNVSCFELTIGFRFFTCIQEGLRPAGRSLLTNDECPRRIPDGCYDTGDGYYNPKTKCVMSVIKPGRILRIPTKSEETWIMENCRKAWDEPTGYKPNLYEKWASGRKGECEERESIEFQFSEYNTVS